MIRLVRDLRIVPIALVAVIGLFVLKTFGLVLDGGYTLGGQKQEPASTDAASSQSWAQQMFGFPGRGSGTTTTTVTAAAQNARDNSDITGSVPSAPAKTAAREDPAKATPANPPPDKSGRVTLPESGRAPSPAERAILERLQERRGELEGREREIEMRENLLKAAEKKFEDRMSELKALEQRVNDLMLKKDETEAARFKSLVSMYENMKAKDAAKIFDRLDNRVLLDVSSQINPRRMSDILAQMNPEAAERLTVELANRFNGDKKALPAADTALLPKIEGRPTAPMAPPAPRAAAAPPPPAPSAPPAPVRN